MLYFSQIQTGEGSRFLKILRTSFLNDSLQEAHSVKGLLGGGVGEADGGYARVGEHARDPLHLARDAEDVAGRAAVRLRPHRRETLLRRGAIGSRRTLNNIPSEVRRYISDNPGGEGGNCCH